MVISKLKLGHLKTSQLMYFIDNTFPSDEVFTDVNVAYLDFTDNLISVIDVVAPIKEFE